MAMNIHAAMISLLGLLVGAGATAEPYDYFRNIQYPGERRPDVGLDKVHQEGGEHAAASYGRRIVEWWPKQGVDRVDIPEGVELRTWTLRTPEIEPLMEASIHRKWLPETLRDKKQFKAHLLGFRGLGSDSGFPFADPIVRRVRGEGMCPAVVLRLEDGRKRCFTRGTFSDEDQAYLRDLYRREMDRLRETQAPHPTKVDPNQIREFPQGELYQPGTYRLESDFFVFLSGSQTPIDADSAWVNENHKEVTSQYRAATVRHFEDYWAYLEYAGERRRFWNDPVDTWYKYRVKVPGTMRDGFGVIPGFAGGGYNACEIKDASWPAFYHEWAHGTPTSTGLGSGEAKCDSYQPMADPTLIGKVEHQIVRPFKNLFYGWYPAALAWTMMGDDPNWGYAAIATLHSQGDRVATPMHKIAKLGEERGIWSDGIRGVGDFMGQMGARFAEYDWELEGELRAAFPAPNRAYLVALDREARRYRSDPVEAPEPFGVNLVRLEADPDATEIKVDFQGHFDPDTFSDWRACIVAVGEDGLTRYSPLWNRGIMSMETRPGDQRYWLTVTATPYALSNAHQDGWWYESPYAYQYPYDVQFSGCRPVGPHAPVGVNRNMDLIGPSWMRNAITGGPRGVWMDLPHPADTPQHTEMKEHLESLLEKVPMALTAHMQEGLFNDPLGGSRMRALEAPVLLQLRARYLLENAQGRRHPNGGGWVARSATVAPTAFVGPGCMVLDGASVLDHASIEDHAIVSGAEVLIKDHAKVYGKAIVSGHVELSGYARVRRNIINRTIHSEYEPDGVAAPHRVEIASVGKVTRTGPELRRFLFEGLEPLGLQANYQFDQRENILMEDHYQEHGRDAYLEDLIFYNGILFGRPGFTQEEDVRAATFNGRNQYAEAASDVADLGQIAIDMSIKWAGGSKQTLFDFGASDKSCFKLVLPPSGKPLLQIRTDERNEDIASSRAIAQGKWTRCRVEIDGRKITLWLDGEMVAEADSEFRAADAYPSGTEKRNFVAASRGGKGFYRGAIEYLRIFHVVHEDFNSIPEIPLVSSRRINSDYVERYKRKYADYDVKETLARAQLPSNEMHTFYRGFYADYWRRINELEASEEADRLEVGLRALILERERRQAELNQEFAASPETVAMQEEHEQRKRSYEEKRSEVQTGYEEELAQIREREREAATIRNEIEREARERIADDLAVLDAEKAAVEEILALRVKALLDADPAAVKIAEDLEALRERQAAARQRGENEGATAMEGEIRRLNGVYARFRNELMRGDRETDALRRSSEGVSSVMRAKLALASSRDPRYEEALKTLDDVSRRSRTILRDLIPKDPELQALATEMGAYDPEPARRDFVYRHTRDMEQRITAAQAAISQERLRAALSRNADEYHALRGVVGWTEREQFRILSQRVLSRELPAITECPRRFDPAFASQQASWHFRVDWDDRLDWEKQPFERLSPIVQSWLRRMKPYVYK